MEERKTSPTTGAQMDWPLENHPMLSEHWLDDLDEAIEEFERSIVETDELLGRETEFEPLYASKRRR
jgi:hypothetical protein